MFLDMDVYGCLTIDVYGRLVTYEADVLGCSGSCLLWGDPVC